MEGRDRLIRLIAGAAAAVACIAPAAATAYSAPPSAAGDWIVSARAEPDAERLAQQFGGRPLGRGGRYRVRGAEVRDLTAALRRRGLLRWAEPDRPLRRPVAVLSAEASWRDRLGLAGLLPPEAGGPVLALLDSPVDLTHPALAGARVVAMDPLAPFDLHGTATAAVAAGTGAGGVLGVWPGMRVASHAFGEDRLTCGQSAYLIDRAVAQGAAVINMSYGSDEPCFTELAALQAAAQRDVVIVAAAGNDGRFGDRMYPAAFPHVVSVAALGAGEHAASFSSAGAAIDLSAPGTDVLTAVPPAFDPDGTPDGWSRLSGTSFSAPMVAAAATALRAARPDLTASQVTAVLRRSARDLPPAGWDRRTGWGVLDLAAAMRARAPEPDPAEPNDDVVWVDGIGLGRAAAPLWTGERRHEQRAVVTAQDDPVDVYRMRLPARSRVRVALTPQTGGADLRVLDRTALAVTDRVARLAASSRPGRRMDEAVVANRTRHARAAYVAVLHDRRGAREAEYRLVLQRTSQRAPMRGFP